MNKLRLFFLFLLSAWMLQSCKKDTFTATIGNPNIKLQAIIDGAQWAPSDTIATSVTYDAAAKNKVFFCQGTIAQKQVSMSVLIKNNSNTPGFTVGTYNVDNTDNVKLQYYTQQKNTAGSYVFVPVGTVSPASGTVVITAVDSTSKVITGTFNFISRQVNLDNSGNISSIEIHNISSGVFNKLPYTYVTK